MEKIKKLFAHRIFRIFMWVFLFLVAFYVALVIYRVFYLFDLEKTNEQVDKIHSTKLTMDDVMGKNLPPDPGAEADKTVEGIDANKNGIRDDVELAVFKEYPNSAKTRAVLLQYALALQMMITQPILNEEIATSVMREKSRAYICIGEALVRDDEDLEVMDKYFRDGDILRSFVEIKQLNNPDRIKNNKDFYEKVRSYEESDNEVCDVNISRLLN